MWWKKMIICRMSDYYDKTRIGAGLKRLRINDSQPVLLKVSPGRSGWGSVAGSWAGCILSQSVGLAPGCTGSWTGWEAAGLCPARIWWRAAQSGLPRPPCNHWINRGKSHGLKQKINLMTETVSYGTVLLCHGTWTQYTICTIMLCNLQLVKQCV